jgi:hypothetical protein
LCDFIFVDEYKGPRKSGSLVSSLSSTTVSISKNTAERERDTHILTPPNSTQAIPNNTLASNTNSTTKQNTVSPKNTPTTPISSKLPKDIFASSEKEKGKV